MPATNSIMVIVPYWYEGTWVFDDDRVGLVREPFVSGIPEMIDLLVKDIPAARDGFRLHVLRRASPATRKNSMGPRRIRRQLLSHGRSFHGRLALPCTVPLF